MNSRPLHPETLTWTALLGKWISFAKASVALPDDEEGRNWRDSVVAIINLQAVTFALAEIGELVPQDRPVALDRAEMMIDENQKSLERTWGKSIPESLSEIVDDARKAHVLARSIDSPGIPGTSTSD
ncbi:MAG: hypothetical protein O7G85_15195 [Planctomycetota bacterium]|nr:hypothetical protein [Planctomycetota bacterium]